MFDMNAKTQYSYCNTSKKVLTLKIKYIIRLPNAPSSWNQIFSDCAVRWIIPEYLFDPFTPLNSEASYQVECIFYSLEQSSMTSLSEYLDFLNWVHMYFQIFLCHVQLSLNNFVCMFGCASCQTYIGGMFFK